MEQNWESINKPLHLWSIDFQRGYQDHSVGEDIFQQMVLGQLAIHMQKNQAGSPTSHYAQKLTQNGS